MVSSSCSTCGTRFTLDTDLVISHEIQQDPEWFYINSIYSVSSVYNLLTFDEFNIRINSLYIGDSVLVGFSGLSAKTVLQRFITLAPGLYESNFLSYPAYINALLLFLNPDRTFRLQNGALGYLFSIFFVVRRKFKQW